MAKLAQILAIEKQIKANAQSILTNLYHTIQKPELLRGISRSYMPKDDEGEKLPSENGKVQVRVQDELKKVIEVLSRHFDVSGTKEMSNTKAKANVVVDGKILLQDIPATYLLFLEKQLVDLSTLVKKMPTLEASESWVKDPITNLWATVPVETARSKKIPRNHEKAPATDKHPAQVEVYMEDVVVGYWKTIKYSSALSQQQVDDILSRIEKLSAAVKFAREEANSSEVTDLKAGKPVLDYLFGLV